MDLWRLLGEGAGGYERTRRTPLSTDLKYGSYVGSSICYPLSLANFSVTVLFYQFFIMLIGYGLNDVQDLQNKAAKTALKWPLYSSATDALVT